MALHAHEIVRFKAALERSVKAPSASEIAGFIARLKRISIETLHERLAEPAVGRKWRRDLAQAEVDRRDKPVGAFAGGGAPSLRRPDVPGWGRWLAGSLIAGSSAAVIYTAYLVWSM
jgi:hypothetical protein